MSNRSTIQSSDAANTSALAEWRSACVTALTSFGTRGQRGRTATGVLGTGSGTHSGRDALRIPTGCFQKQADLNPRRAGPKPFVWLS
jgi:hypothetical protein